MRMFKGSVLFACATVAVFAMTRTYAFDGPPDADSAVAPLGAVPTPSGVAVVKKTLPPNSNAPTALQYAAEDGHAIAQWKLCKMFADGVGGERDDLRAFDYFSRIANQHSEDIPHAPHANIVANAFVA